ncbi:YheV family putative zinc ribbon protein [Aliiglaciecola litoralis]|uniref:YheV family putative zinc ribbon protein n=1 Tax=Aliiglaciecola litoralis TaxID=582857 RepID=A0ABN1LEZ8_9ALTE
MNKKTKKRFVAGAICPKCKAMDTIMLFFENNIEKLECVQCDYHEVQTEEKIDQAKRQNESVIGVFKPD